MAELHSVDMSDVGMSSREYSEVWETSVSKNVATWLGPAQVVLALPGMPQAIKRELNLERFRDEWAKYMLWLRKVDDVNSGSRRVFAHNDTQYGNLLRLKRVEKNLEEHRQVSWHQSCSCDLL
jgi:choline kinase